MSKTAQRKAKLRAELIAAAITRIDAHGVANLRARDLARDAGCSVGSIYNVFDDLHELILHANFHALQRIDDAMVDRLLSSTSDPAGKLVELAWAYFDFAETHINTWRGLFDHRFPANYQSPGWMQKGQMDMLAHIEKPLTELFGNTDSEEITILAQTLFSSVHGCVVLSLDDRTVGLPKDLVEDQLKLLVTAFLIGYGQSGTNTA